MKHNFEIKIQMKENIDDGAKSYIQKKLTSLKNITA